MLGSNSDKKDDVEKKTHLIWKMINFVAFSSRKPYAAKYTCSPSKNFKLFYKDMYISWLSGTLFKINHDITSAEITSDFGVVNFLKHQLINKSILLNDWHVYFQFMCRSAKKTHHAAKHVLMMKWRVIKRPDLHKLVRLSVGLFNN